MKIFNIIKKVILVLAFVFTGVAFVLGGITLNQIDVTFSSALVAYVIIGFVGFFLMNAKNEIAKKVGLGITTGFMVILFYLSLVAISNSTAAIMGLVSVVLYVVYFLIALIGRIAIGSDNDNDPETDPKIKKILGWKKLQEEGIISAEEFEEKRQEILCLKKNNLKK